MSGKTDPRKSQVYTWQHLFSFQWSGWGVFPLPPQTWPSKPRRTLKVVMWQRSVWERLYWAFCGVKGTEFQFLRRWKRKGAWRGRGVTGWVKRWLGDDFTVQGEDEITRTGWASLQSLEAGSAGKWVTQKVLGWEKDGIAPSRKGGKRREKRGVGIQGEWTPLPLRGAGNLAAGEWDPRRSRASWGYIQELGGRETGRNMGTPARGTLRGGAEV